MVPYTDQIQNVDAAVKNHPPWEGGMNYIKYKVVLNMPEDRLLRRRDSQHLIYKRALIKF